jgi:Cu2+-containing amine oxidase
MDRDNEQERAAPEEVPLVPAATVGFLLYPWAIQLILANPPANDFGFPAPATT